MWFRRVLVVGVIIFAMSGASSVSWAREPEGPRAADIVDLVVLRPLGFVATIVGTCVFVVTLPFTVPTRAVDKSADTFVVTPFKYTFSRPFPDRDLSR